MGSKPRRITVEIEAAAEPICGRVVGDGSMRPFTGWLELAAALRAGFDALTGADGDEPATG